MFRSIVCAAVAAAVIAFAVPAQAATADAGLNAAAPATLQLAYYRHDHDSWRHSYAYVPHRRHWSCWNERVRSWHHWRWVRHCGWRYW